MNEQAGMKAMHRALESIKKEINSVDAQLKKATEEVLSHKPNQSEASGRRKIEKQTMLQNRLEGLNEEFAAANEILNQLGAE